MREGARRLQPVLRIAMALSLGVAGGVMASAAPALAAGPGPAGPGPAARPGADAAGVAAALGIPVAAPVAGASLAGSIPALTRSGRPGAAPAIRHPASKTVALRPLGRLREADLLVVAPTALPSGVTAAIGRLPGVAAAESLDAATIKVDGRFIQMLGVNPDTFRAFAAAPTARSATLWRSVAGGGVALSYTMGKLGKLRLGSTVQVAGHQPEMLRVGAFGTVGIAGVDAVVSAAVASSLGLPAGNAVVISAPSATLVQLTARVKALLPKGAGIAQLVADTGPGVTGTAAVAAAGAAGAASYTSADGALSTPQLQAFLSAALSRVGLPYVWGAAGPSAFDCSGLVQWSMRRAGLVMPRVAADQARTGPLVRLSDLRPGDLLFYHTDATAPLYISHVAIYIGNGKMLQAPEPGENVEIVPADFGGGFAGAVQVSPVLAAAVAGNPAG